MKRRLPFIVLVAAVIAAAALLTAYLRHAIEVMDVSELPATPLPEPASAPAPASTPKEVVASYLEALENEEHRTAHGLLSEASRRAHPYEEFVALCEQGEAPHYDLAPTREIAGEGEEVVVLVPIMEDPAEASFTTVREGGAWRVVFIEGAPWFPYP